MPRTTASRPTTPCRRRGRRAFTLIEMIVVVLIIGILATLIAPRIIGRVGEAKIKKAESAVSILAMQVESYMLDTGVSQLDDTFDLQTLLLPPDDGGGPNGPYLQKAMDLVDPWETPYIIRVPGDINYDFDIVSAGEDGEFGTEDDITN